MTLRLKQPKPLPLKMQLEYSLTREKDLAQQVAEQGNTIARQRALISEHEKGIANLKKAVDAAGVTIVGLKENLQRAMGYINRINEDLPPLALVDNPQQPQTYYAPVQPQRGPRMEPVTIQVPVDENHNRRY